ncbi:MAG: hypothetical protein UR28_C0023G0017 [Candidatus Peregrinibacteria bacterium GW2011_GWF2_33_10]|nr:MAG: hypothetical protein UR28_C0023G0017 [Candidatus Peregrinibacteria bacterium GW2011_GWF2_33_10]OGJ44149.1 MAG: hypothetical protein A2272_02185 [Candidatus Peregrinibacteria bacterium RIFOXYA12_FULL_33_12]OGJ50795.1 MAG: hypothetical protein A2307_01995 [Candidatus Peregrinibacteria bacterium RIFOXYB2_FULL_33_20]
MSDVEVIGSSWKEVRIDLTTNNLATVAKYIEGNGLVEYGFIRIQGGEQLRIFDFDDRLPTRSDIIASLELIIKESSSIVISGSGLTDPGDLGSYVDESREEVGCGAKTVRGGPISSQMGKARGSVVGALQRSGDERAVDEELDDEDRVRQKRKLLVASFRVEDIRRGEDLLRMLCEEGEMDSLINQPEILSSRFRAVAKTLKGYDRIVVDCGGGRNQCYFLSSDDWYDFFNKLNLILKLPIRILKPEDAVQSAEISEDGDSISCEVYAGTISQEDAETLNTFLDDFLKNSNDRYNAYGSILIQLLNEKGIAALNTSWSRIGEKEKGGYNERDIGINGQEVALSKLERLALKEKGDSGRYNRMHVELKDRELIKIYLSCNTSQVGGLRIKLIKKPKNPAEKYLNSSPVTSAFRAEQGGGGEAEMRLGGVNESLIGHQQVEITSGEILAIAKYIKNNGNKNKRELRVRCENQVIVLDFSNTNLSTKKIVEKLNYVVTSNNSIRILVSDGDLTDPGNLGRYINEPSDAVEKKKTVLIRLTKTNGCFIENYIQVHLPEIGVVRFKHPSRNGMSEEIIIENGQVIWPERMRVVFGEYYFENCFSEIDNVVIITSKSSLPDFVESDDALVSATDKQKKSNLEKDSTSQIDALGHGDSDQKSGCGEIGASIEKSPEPIHILSENIFPCEIERINKWIQEGNSLILINKKDKEVQVGDCNGFVCEGKCLYKNNNKRRPKFVFENFKEIRFVKKG